MDIRAMRTKHFQEFVVAAVSDFRFHKNLQEPSKPLETSTAVGLTHPVSNGSSKGLHTSQKNVDKDGVVSPPSLAACAQPWDASGGPTTVRSGLDNLPLQGYRMR